MRHHPTDILLAMIADLGAVAHIRREFESGNLDAKQIPGLLATRLHNIRAMTYAIAAEGATQVPAHPCGLDSGQELLSAMVGVGALSATIHNIRNDPGLLRSEMDKAGHRALAVIDVHIGKIRDGNCRLWEVNPAAHGKHESTEDPA